jgi:hypothetical protein
MKLKGVAVATNTNIKTAHKRRKNSETDKEVASKKKQEKLSIKKSVAKVKPSTLKVQSIIKGTSAKDQLSVESTPLTLVKVVEVPSRQLNCLACNYVTKFNEYGGDWYCDVCGRNENASIKFLKSTGGNTQLTQSNSGSLADGYIELAIKTTLLIGLFPISLLFLVVCYGMDGAVEVVKKIIIDLFKSAISLVMIAAGLWLFTVLILYLFRSVK